MQFDWRKPPRILFLSSRLPYPPIGGDRLKNFSLLQILARYCDVHLVSLSEDRPSDAAVSFLEEHTAAYRVFRKSRVSSYINACKSLWNGLPLQVNYYHYGDVQGYVTQHARQADLLFSTLIRTARYGMGLRKPKILDLADSVGLNYQASAARTLSPFWRRVYRFEAARLLAFERQAIAAFDRSLFFNREEMAYFRQPERTVWIPHGVSEALLSYRDADPRYNQAVVFLGKMDTQHNVDAVLWFCAHVLPRLKEGIRFVIVGANPGRRVRKLAQRHRNVEVTGYVGDPYAIVKASLCTVAPMRTGGGIQNKILEAMALGCVVVTTAKAAAPIEGARNNRELVVADSPSDMAHVINEMFSDAEKYKRIREKAAALIRRRFTWSNYERILIKVVEEVLEGRARLLGATRRYRRVSTAR